DWNTFLLRFNNLDFCISENETLKHILNDTSPPESTVTTGQARSSTQTPQALEDTGPINISVAITLTQPPHCIPETYSNATLWYKMFTTARDSGTKYAQDYNPFWCYKGAIGKVYHALNPKLTVIVPEDDRSLINLHLMDTSYFLFVMVITMFCYAVIRGRPSKIRQNNAEFCQEK
ncbi:hypothetical protein AB205_0204300, partial [Aquarana catesbeiana]